MEDPQTVPSTPAPPPASAAATSGLADNIAGALAYCTFVPAVLFLILEPYNKRRFVRFNAFQCLGLYVAGFVGSLICAIIPFLGWFVLAPLLGLTLICTFLFCIFKTYNGATVKLPLIGKYAENFADQ
jgi:uncharacterized membrane protein